MFDVILALVIMYVYRSGIRTLDLRASAHEACINPQDHGVLVPRNKLNYTLPKRCHICSIKLLELKNMGLCRYIVEDNCDEHTKFIIAHIKVVFTLLFQRLNQL